jgi:hypothetical protein
VTYDAATGHSQNDLVVVCLQTGHEAGKETFSQPRFSGPVPGAFRVKPYTMFEQTFKNIDDILHKDAGCGSELDYVEQTSWVLFLKYLDDLEKDKQTAAELKGTDYTPIMAPEYQWSVWAAPKTFIDFQKYLYQQKAA